RKWRSEAELRFESMGISFRSAEPSRYQYRFSGSGVFENKFSVVENWAENAARDLLQRQRRNRIRSKRKCIRNNLARSFTGSRLLHNGYGEVREASIRAAFWRLLELSRSRKRPGGVFCLPVYRWHAFRDRHIFRTC